MFECQRRPNEGSAKFPKGVVHLNRLALKSMSHALQYAGAVCVWSAVSERFKVEINWAVYFYTHIYNTAAALIKARIASLNPSMATQ